MILENNHFCPKTQAGIREKERGEGKRATATFEGERVKERKRERVKRCNITDRNLPFLFLSLSLSSLEGKDGKNALLPGNEVVIFVGGRERERKKNEGMEEQRERTRERSGNSMDSN